MAIPKQVVSGIYHDATPPSLPSMRNAPTKKVVPSYQDALMLAFYPKADTRKNKKSLPECADTHAAVENC